MKSKFLTRDYLKEILSYDKETGYFYWKKNRARNIVAGEIAGYVSESRKGKKYIKICMGGTCYYAHRLAYLYINGKFPEKHIDHIDGDGTNNSWTNLRDADRSANSKNMKLFKNNSSGFCGVTMLDGKWAAQIKTAGKYIYLGSFDKKSDAINARKEANKKYGFSDLHGVRVFY